VKLRYRWSVLALATLSLALASCAGVPGASTSTPAADDQEGRMITGTARVEEIEIMILESFPVQVHVVVRGNLPDGCTTIDRIEQERRDSAFQITIATVRPADRMCTQALVPFEEVVSLDVVGLKAGTYTVNVNGMQDTFNLAVDNTLSGP
jgi:inhibitor of cysteine peptidase